MWAMIGRYFIVESAEYFSEHNVKNSSENPIPLEISQKPKIFHLVMASMTMFIAYSLNQNSSIFKID